MTPEHPFLVEDDALRLPSPVLPRHTMNPEPEHPWLESDSEYEGVGGHRDNPRFDLETALADAAAAAEQEEPDATP